MKKDYTVTRSDTALSLGSGNLEVLATPILVAWVENAAYEMAQLCLADEQTTVGVKVDLDHVAATPVGMKVRIHAVLEKVENRRLDFKIEAWDEVQKIGEGFHQRFVVTKTKFMGKVFQKKQQLKDKA